MLAGGETCNVRVQIVPPQCPTHPTKGYSLPIEDDKLERQLHVGPIDAPATAGLTILGAAGYFTALAGKKGIDNKSGVAQILGNVGVTHGGRIEGEVVVLGKRHRDDLLSRWAQRDLAHAIRTLERLDCTPLSHKLGASGSVASVTPGVYCPASYDSSLNNGSPNFEVVGKLTLDANHNPLGLFVFKTSALIAQAKSHIEFINSAHPLNVFWVVESDSNSVLHNSVDYSVSLRNEARFAGSILLAIKDSQAAYSGGSITPYIHMETDASLWGRALTSGIFYAPVGIVLHGNSITDPRY